MATTEATYAARGDVITHKELLAKIKTPNEFLGIKYAPDWQHVALLAVVELHKPEEVELKHDWFQTKCSHLFCQEFYPCPTIQAIEKELK